MAKNKRTNSRAIDATKADERRYSLLDSNSEDILSGRLERPAAQKTAPQRSYDRRTVYIWIVVAVSLIAAVFIFSRMLMTVNEQLALEIMVNETDITDVSDGVYTASYESAHMSATVSVSIQSGKMIAITLDSCTSIDRARASEVFDEVIYYQMLNVPNDDIGTQPTDKIVLKAIEAALSGANG